MKRFKNLSTPTPEPFDLFDTLTIDKTVDKSTTSKNKNKNPFPLIFTGEDKKTFTLFETFTKLHIIDKYVDFSFIFQQMKFNGYILDIKHKTFMNWLKQNQYINDKEYTFFFEQNTFRALKKCAFGTRVDLYLKLEQEIIQPDFDKTE